MMEVCQNNHKHYKNEPHKNVYIFIAKTKWNFERKILIQSLSHLNTSTLSFLGFARGG